MASGRRRRDGGAATEAARHRDAKLTATAALTPTLSNTESLLGYKIVCLSNPSLLAMSLALKSKPRSVGSCASTHLRQPTSPLRSTEPLYMHPDSFYGLAIPSVGCRWVATCAWARALNDKMAEMGMQKAVTTGGKDTVTRGWRCTQPRCLGQGTSTVHICTAVS
jgi:hypothetical protein